MSNTEQQFREELNALLEKYNATLWVDAEELCIDVETDDGTFSLIPPVC